MKINLSKRRANRYLDIESDAKEQKIKWEDMKTEELEKLFAELTISLKSTPQSSWTAWDEQSLKIAQKILTDRRADDVRRDIARILELSGLHYGIEKQTFQNRQVRLNSKHD